MNTEPNLVFDCDSFTEDSSPSEAGTGISLEGALSLIFWLAFFALGSVAGYSVYHSSSLLWNRVNIIFFVAAPLVIMAIALFGNTTARGRKMRPHLLLAAISSLLALYLGELFLIVAGPYLGGPPGFDSRPKIQVIEDLRAQGVDAYPSTHPAHYLGDPLLVDGSPTVPLSGIAKVRTVFCNELGTYYIFDSDELGFANPAGSFMNSGVNLMLLGDSFTQGFCVPDGQSYPERLRASFGSTINLAMSGSGPLLELAAAREYLPVIKPQKVLWFFFEGNDIEDLTIELRDPFVRQYYESSTFSQHLMARRESVDQALKELTSKKFNEESTAFHKGALQKAVVRVRENVRFWATLWNIRERVGLTEVKRVWTLHRFKPTVTDSEVEGALSKIFAEVKALTESNGGELFFIYIPDPRNFSRGLEHPYKNRVLAQMRALGAPVLDLTSEISLHRDPASLYVPVRDGHFTVEGNRIVASRVTDWLKMQKAVKEKERP